jgi:hypothetical protein
METDTVASVRQVNLAQVADELYALAPAEFRAARDGRAAQERAAGRQELADAIAKLRRPTVSAWLVNQLAREAADQVGRLLALGESLREAQQELAGDRLRDLSAQRRETITPLIQAAKRIASGAGQSVSAGVEREILATFEAALADPDAADAVRSGWLTSALSYVGLGGADLADVVALPARPSRPPGRVAREKGETTTGAPVRRDGAGATPSPGERPGTRGREREESAEARRREREAAEARGRGREAPAEARGREREAAEVRRREREAAAAHRAAREAEAAESDLREAAAMAQEAKVALEDADRGVAGAREQQASVRRRIEELEQQLAASEVERAETARSLREAQRHRERAAQSLDAAQRRLARAQARAERHRSG